MHDNDGDHRHRVGLSLRTRAWHCFADLDKGTADEWIPRDPELIRLTGRHPFNVRVV
jgi:hypothetical protein